MTNNDQNNVINKILSALGTEVQNLYKLISNTPKKVLAEPYMTAIKNHIHTLNTNFNQMNSHINDLHVENGKLTEEYQRELTKYVTEIGNLSDIIAPLKSDIENLKNEKISSVILDEYTEKIIAPFNQLLNVKDETIRKLQQQNVEFQNQLNIKVESVEQDTQTEEFNAEEIDKENDRIVQEAIAKGKAEASKEYQAQIKQQDDDTSGYVGLVQDLGEALSQKDVEIARLNQQLADMQKQKDAEIEKLKKQLADTQKKEDTSITQTPTEPSENSSVHEQQRTEEEIIADIQKESKNLVDEIRNSISANRSSSTTNEPNELDIINEARQNKPQSVNNETHKPDKYFMNVAVMANQYPSVMNYITALKNERDAKQKYTDGAIDIKKLNDAMAKSETAKTLIDRDLFDSPFFAYDISESIASELENAESLDDLSKMDIKVGQPDDLKKLPEHSDDNIFSHDLVYTAATKDFVGDRYNKLIDNRPSVSYVKDIFAEFEKSGQYAKIAKKLNKEDRETLENLKKLLEGYSDTDKDGNVTKALLKENGKKFADMTKALNKLSESKVIQNAAEPNGFSRVFGAKPDAFAEFILETSNYFHNFVKMTIACNEISAIIIKGNNTGKDINTITTQDAIQKYLKDKNIEQIKKDFDEGLEEFSNAQDRVFASKPNSKVKAKGSDKSETVKSDAKESKQSKSKHPIRNWFDRKFEKRHPEKTPIEMKPISQPESEVVTSSMDTQQNDVSITPANSNEHLKKTEKHPIKDWFVRVGDWFSSKFEKRHPEKTPIEMKPISQPGIEMKPMNNNVSEQISLDNLSENKKTKPAQKTKPQDLKKSNMIEMK